MIVFISCVKRKRDVSCKAGEMYVSALFKYSYEYAKSLNPNHIYILSALYGLLELDDWISPYDKTLLKMKKEERDKWSAMVHDQMVKKGIDFSEEAVFCCGERYREGVAKYFKNCKFPTKGLAYGKCLKFLKESIDA